MNMKSKNKQSGAVLVIGIVMLLILSVVVAAASKSTLLQQKMTSNFRDRELSFQGAETAINTGEVLLRSMTDLQLREINFDGSSGYYSYDSARSLKEETDWENLNTLDSEQGLHQLKEAPEYIIESIIGVQPPGGSLQVPKVVDSYYYRVTGKSKGGTDNSLSVIQTIFKK